MIGDLAAPLLGRHVERRADDGAVARELGVAAHALDQPEVEDLDAGFVVEHEVRRLDVAVDEALREGGAQAARGRQRVVDGLGPGQGRALGENGVEPRSFEVLHDEEVETAILADEVDLRDVGVAQARLGACLAREALGDLGLVSDVEREDLDGHGPVERNVGAVVHGPHAAAAEQAHQREVLQARAGQPIGKRIFPAAGRVLEQDGFVESSTALLPVAHAARILALAAKYDCRERRATSARCCSSRSAPRVAVPRADWAGR